MDSFTRAEKMTRVRDRYELPATVTIKIHTRGLDQDLLDAIRCLLVSNKDELPFDLARYVAWPSHQRAITARAQIFFAQRVSRSRREECGRPSPPRCDTIATEGWPGWFSIRSACANLAGWRGYCQRSSSHWVVSLAAVWGIVYR